MKKILEKTLYSFGINISNYDVSKELNLMEKHLPESFRFRNVVDIGCGDGAVTVKLKEILKPNEIKGIDSSDELVKSAIKKKVNAEVLDIEKQKIRGDLGILWGVLHHFNDPEKTIKNIKVNFNSLIIREPVNEKRIFELGHRMNKQKLLDILSGAGIDIGKCKIVDLVETKGLLVFIGE